MRRITAKVLDPTRLELSLVIGLPPGESIEITVRDPGDREPDWREEARRRFLEAYDAEDVVYDAL